MFTGLIDDVGVVERVEQTDAGRELRVRSRYERLADGESIAVNGACLTVRESGDGWFAVAAIVTTLERTTIGSWEAGRRLNLERAMRLGDRLGGHLVQGHVDAVATVESVRQLEDAMLIDVRLPETPESLVVPHGSVALDGVSLTVNALPAQGVLQVAVIEYTLGHTTLGSLRPGDAVNVEADMVGKYVRQLVAPYVEFR